VAIRTTEMSILENKVPEEEIIIRPPEKALPRFEFRELFRYRQLLFEIVWRELRVQYNDLYLGFFWAVARPLAMLLVFTGIKNLSRANLYVSIPYALYFYSGIILWFYFVEATKASEKSVMRDAGMMKEIYYPRIISPVDRIISPLLTLALSMIPLVIMMVWAKIPPGWNLALLPLVLIQCMALCFGVGTFFSSLLLTRRDYERTLDLILYLGLFVSPVIYSPDMIPARGQLFYFLNPMAGTLLAFRSCLFHDFPFPFEQFAYSCIFSISCLIFGTKMFRRAEVFFADKL
jgi:lipopolysaccharide transport system permease protein